MKRLTERIQRPSKEDLIVFRDDKAKLNCLLPNEMTKDSIRIMLKKLAAYEDNEEQGLLLRLPCKVGTIIYQIENNTDACCKCNYFENGGYDYDYCINKNVHDEDEDVYVFNPQYADKPLCKKQFYEIKEYTMKTIDEIFRRRNDFGKTVFLSRAEAESKLAEMEGAE